MLVIPAGIDSVQPHLPPPAKLPSITDLEDLLERVGSSEGREREKFLRSPANTRHSISSLSIPEDVEEIESEDRGCSTPPPLAHSYSLRKSSTPAPKPARKTSAPPSSQFLALMARRTGVQTPSLVTKKYQQHNKRLLSLESISSEPGSGIQTSSAKPTGGGATGGSEVDNLLISFLKTKRGGRQKKADPRGRSFSLITDRDVTSSGPPHKEQSPTPLTSTPGLLRSSGGASPASPVLSACLQCQAMQRRGSQHSTTPCGSSPCLSPDGSRPPSCADYVGIFDIFKIGIGPSSSHTMGPMVAAKRFMDKVSRLSYPNSPGFEGRSCSSMSGVGSYEIAKIRIDLYGSLASTGKGHNTDRAVILGLCGFEPSTMDPDAAEVVFERIRETQQLKLAESGIIRFDTENDVVFHMDEELALHPNGMRIAAFSSSPQEQGDQGGLGSGVTSSKTCQIATETYYSIGGGFVKTEAEMLNCINEGIGSQTPLLLTSDNDDDILSASDQTPSTQATAGELPTSPCSPKSGKNSVPHFFPSCESLLSLCETTGLSIAEVMLENETVSAGISRGEVNSRLDKIAEIMQQCIRRGLDREGTLPVSGIPRRAIQIKRRLEENTRGEAGLRVDPLLLSDWIALYARAVNEENACGGQVVTAPTNGAAGTVPAVLEYYRRFIPGSTRQGVREFLATAAAVGSLCKRNASISGAEAGCQAEVGSACAMAAGGLTAVLGGSVAQVENAAEIALEHCLGMTCDPIDGLVQIPCIERNCVAAVKAVLASRLALCGDGSHEVSLDCCIETMYRTGLDMNTKYRETSTGGLALYARRKKTR